MRNNPIIMAAQFAAKAHWGQLRKFSGRPYIEHPARVATGVMLLRNSKLLCEDIVCAAWMHDVLEDCPGVEIPAYFGAWVQRLVQGLTNPSKQHPTLPRNERKAMDRQHLKNCEGWVQIIKLIDRIDNVRELDQAPADFRSLYIRESELLCEALDAPAHPVIGPLCRELQWLLRQLVAGEKLC